MKLSLSIYLNGEFIAVLHKDMTVVDVIAFNEFVFRGLRLEVFSGTIFGPKFKVIREKNTVNYLSKLDLRF